MTAPLLAALAALVIWWVSTGVILVAVRLAEGRGARAGRRATLAALPLMGLGAWGYLASLDGSGPGAAYATFGSVLLIWGWIELAFLTGTITGPVTSPLPPGKPEAERFIRAWGTVAYHEMMLTAALIFVLLTGWGAANTFGLWSFVILYFARISAKLNLYLGVPHANTEFLPRQLAHLASHFRVRRMNALFPVSVTALTFALGCWLERLVAATAPAEQTGYALLAALTALAILEHWLLVLPLPDAKLWRWMLPTPAPGKGPKTQETRHGV